MYEILITGGAGNFGRGLAEALREQGHALRILDLPSCEVLENALDEFEGTALVISHDRYFLDRVVDSIVELEEGSLTEYPGNYTYYHRGKERRVEDAR